MARLLSSSLSYSSLTGLTLDSSLFEIVSSRLQLKLQPNPEQIFSQDFSSATGFTYNSSLAEFVGGVVRQVDQTPANSVFAGKFDTTANLNWHKSGSTTGVPNGSPTITAGKLVCTGTQGVYFVGNTNTDESFKFRYTPNYLTAPPQNLNIFSIYNGANTNDRFDLTHSPSGGSTIRITAYNSEGTLITGVAQNIASWDFTQDQEYELEVGIDATIGSIDVFIDGQLIGGVSITPWTRGTAASRYYLGASPSIYDVAQGTFDDCIKFSTIQHTASYTPGYTIPGTIYATSKVDGPPFSYVGVGTVLSVDDSVVQETGIPHFILDGEYHNGSAWVTSDGTYAQANTSADLIANLNTFAGNGSPFSWSVVFPDTNTQASVDFFSIEVTGQIYTQGGVRVVHDTLIKTDALSSVTSDVNVSGSDSIKHYIVVDGAPKYFNGASWVASDETLAQSNTLAEINNNATSLDVSSGVDLQLGAIFVSSDGKTTPDLGMAEVTYDFWAGDPSEYVTTYVYGWIYDEGNSPVSGASVYSELTIKQESGNTIALPRNKKRVSTNSAGYWEMELIPGTYDFIIDGTPYPSIVVPAQDSVGIGTLI